MTKKGVKTETRCILSPPPHTIKDYFTPILLGLKWSGFFWRVRTADRPNIHHRVYDFKPWSKNPPPESPFFIRLRLFIRLDPVLWRAWSGVFLIIIISGFSKSRPVASHFLLFNPIRYVRVEIRWYLKDTWAQTCKGKQQTWAAPEIFEEWHRSFF